MSSRDDVQLICNLLMKTRLIRVETIKFKATENESDYSYYA